MTHNQEKSQLKTDQYITEMKLENKRTLENKTAIINRVSKKR